MLIIRPMFEFVDFGKLAFRFEFSVYLWLSDLSFSFWTEDFTT